MNITKEKLLNIAFDEIYYNGYHATSIDKILKKANASKSSMYYFFKSKKELAKAIIEEKISYYIEEKYAPLLNINENYIESILEVIKNRKDFDFNCGCKLNNFVQELSYKDEDFKNALEKVYFRFENIFEQVLDKAIENKEIIQTDTKSLSMFIVSSIEGALLSAKKSQDEKFYNISILHLENYLNSFKLK